MLELVGAEEDGEGIRDGEGFQDREPLGGGFGVLDFQGRGFRGELKLAIRLRRATEDRPHVRQDDGCDAPELQLGGEAFALARRFVDDPLALFSAIGSGGAGERGEKGMRSLIGMVEHSLPVTGGEGSQVIVELWGCDGSAEPRCFRSQNEEGYYPLVAFTSAWIRDFFTVSQRIGMERRKKE